MPVQKTFSPIDGRLLLERPLADLSEVDALLTRSARAASSWRRVPLAERIAILESAVACFVAETDPLSREITEQMGRPIRYTPGEIRGFADRATTMARLAPTALADIIPPAREGFTRYIRREPVGTVLVLAPWNYPYLTAVNAVWPALLAGNSVVIKHSDQTPVCAERIGEALTRAGLPADVYQHVHMSHETTARVVADDRISHVCFTGSVAGGVAVHTAAAGTFTTVGLELGGKDPSYVRPDADLAHAVETLVDGAYFNSGQSCCGIERIYVHADLYDSFVDGFVQTVGTYVLGNPLDPETTLGPVVRTRAADQIRAQITEAVSAGARTLIDPATFPAAREGTPYLAPQVLVDVDHGMALMREETFGPVVGIMKVESDAAAIALMNDSDFGLTASVFTRDLDAAEAIGAQVETGTFFMNRCDALDPELAWVGIKNSGRGCTLSQLGFDALTRPKSFHLRR